MSLNNAIPDELSRVLGQTRSSLNAFVALHSHNRVLSGPFKGMHILPDIAWGDGDIATRLLGSYEQELHGTLYRFSQRCYEAIVNVGCAEGFYAIGLKRIFADLPVYAFDSSQRAQRICALAATANSVELQLHGACTPLAVEELGLVHRRMLWFIDCEGAERELVTESALSYALRLADLIIECHDFVHVGLTQVLLERLCRTHSCLIVRAGGRDPNQYDFLKALPDDLRWILMSESRPCSMHWLVCEPL